MENEEKYLKNVDTLVPCPEIALEVINIAQDANCNFTKLSEKIEQDQNLVANMLRMANSAYFGHMKKITSVPEIIVRLGLENVKLIAISGATIGLLKSPQEAYHLEPSALWKHSYATAILAEIIGKHCNIEALSTLYTAALLHDVGKVVLNRPLLVAIFNNRAETQQYADNIDFERSMLQTDHARVGMALLQKWDLPGEITVPVGYHHSSEVAKSNRLETQIVQLSNELARSIDFYSLKQEQFVSQALKFVEHEEKLPEISGFLANMEDIFDKFYKKCNDATIQFA